MGQSFHESGGGGQSIPGKHWQRSLPVLSEMPAPESVDDSLIAKLDSMSGAVHLCIYLSRFSNDRICGELGIDPGHWTRMMQGRAHFPLNKLVALEDLCGNLAPTQYLMWQRKLKMPNEAQFKTAEAA
jgi:hypothetical protein